MLKALPKGALAIALDERGEVWDTARLAAELDGWLAGGRDPALMVGGADGLAPEPACSGQSGAGRSRL